jgi:hypothetical protein
MQNRMVSSMLLFLPGAKEFSVPMTLKPDFWRTLSEAAGELVIAGDRAQCDVGGGSDRSHVRIERGPVVRVIRSERGHPDRLGISHLIEQRAEVRVRDRPQGDNWHVS